MSVIPPPPKRALFKDYTESRSSRTGGRVGVYGEGEVNSPTKNHRVAGVETHGLKDKQVQGRTRVGTYVKKPRNPSMAPNLE